MQVCFFPQTENALKNITNTFNTVWPIAAGLWNLRCYVCGVKQEFPSITEAQFASKFSLGSGIHGVNYKHAFFEKNWEDQREDFAWILLNSTIPVFEAWIEDIKKIFPFINVKDIQYKNRISQQIALINSYESLLMKQCFYPAFASQKDSCIINIENLIICFRFFKEIRNCYMHNASIADGKLLAAYNDFAQVIIPADLGIREIPEHYPPVINQKIRISLRGIVGFSAVVRKIMFTLDSELVRTAIAESDFVDRWKSKNLHHRTLKSNPDKAEAQVIRYIKQCGMPTPHALSDLTNYLLANRLISR